MYLAGSLRCSGESSFYVCHSVCFFLCLFLRFCTLVCVLPCVSFHVCPSGICPSSLYVYDPVYILACLFLRLCTFVYPSMCVFSPSMSIIPCVFLHVSFHFWPSMFHPPCVFFGVYYSVCVPPCVSVRVGPSVCISPCVTVPIWHSYRPRFWEIGVYVGRVCVKMFLLCACLFYVHVACSSTRMSSVCRTKCFGNRYFYSNSPR